MKILLPILLLATLLAGCYTGYEDAGNQDELDNARQQAIRDSIARVNDYEMNKSRSFAFEYYKQRNYEQAKRYFLTELELDVNHQFSRDYSMLADCYVRLGQADSARVTYENGLSYNPEDVYLHFALGLLLNNSNQEEALQHYLFVTEHAPDDPEYQDAWLKMKDIYNSQAEYELALGVLDKLIEMHPEDKSYQLEKENILQQYFDPEDVIASLVDSHNRFPDDHTITRRLAEAYFQSTYYQEALHCCEEILDTGERSVDVLQLRASAQESLEKYNEAITSLKEVATLSPEDAEVVCHIANLYRMKGEYQTARSYVYRARRITPDYPHATFILGEIYENTADACTGAEGILFDDKLVYKLAREQFAMVTSDASFGRRARSKVDYLAEYVPQKSDLFMNQDKERPTKVCYQWIFE